MNPRRPSTVLTLLTGIAAVAFASTVFAASSDPIKIGIISEEAAPAGASISRAARIAAKEINADGGINGRKLELVLYDDHSSPADAVRAFQRAVTQDGVVAVAGTYLSEVALGLMPWAARLKTPFLDIGGSSTAIPEKVHDHYDRNKYTFQAYLNGAIEGQIICDFTKDTFVKPFGTKSAVILSEDAAWTKVLDKSLKSCLPDIGISVLDEIRFDPETTDFTPIFNKIEQKNPDIIVTGMAHVGVQPVVQWHARRVPIPLTGTSSQASTSSFWKKTNGTADGVITWTSASVDIPLTDKTVPFAKKYVKAYGVTPSYSGYAAYDAVWILADAIKRAGSTDADKLVAALEKTDFVGTQGRLQFYGRDDPYTHSYRTGSDFMTGIFVQWQNGKQIAIWPESVKQADVVFPSFVKLKNYK